MTPIACSYAALRFLPYRETGEFATVGVVVWAPQAGVFHYRLNQQLGKRLRGFFPELERGLYRDVLRGLEAMLAQVTPQFAEVVRAGEARHERLVERFHELVRVREGMLTFGPAGALLAASPEQALENLYNCLVLRQFARPVEYQEEVMRRRLADSLRAWKLNTLYQKDVTVGDERFHVTVPFAHLAANRPDRILRPVDLAKKDPTTIIQHADRWLSALNRLKGFGTLPERIVIPVRLPSDGDRLVAARIVMDDFRRCGAEPISQDDDEALRSAVLVA